MIGVEADYRRILKQELDTRCGRIPKYSLRAFARDLGLSPSRLSEILSGKQGLSREAAREVAKKMGLSPRDSDVFCDLVESQHARAQVSRELARTRLQKHQLDAAYYTLEPDEFHLLSNWYPFAILQLMEVKGFQGDPGWIARTLGISRAEAASALKRLERLGFIAIRDGKMEPSHPYTATHDEVPSAAIQRFHRQILDRAASALHDQPRESREFSSTLMAIDPAMLPQAKRWLRNFRRRFAVKMNASAERSQVYCLSMQFFNLMRKEPKSK